MLTLLLPFVIVMDKKITNAVAYASLAILQWMWTLYDDKGWVAVYNLALMLNLFCLMTVCLSKAPTHSQIDQWTCMGMFLFTVSMCVSGFIIVLFHMTYSYHFILTSGIGLLFMFASFGVAV